MDSKDKMSTVKGGNEPAVQTSEPSTTSSTQPGPGENEPGVLGQIMTLARIKSEGLGHAGDIAVQSVVSWDLQHKLAVYVTDTSEMAQVLLERHGRGSGHRYLPLDGIKEKIDPPFEVDLQSFTSIGNPVYLRSLLEFPIDKVDVATKVFNYIIGNTILIDDLESAINLMNIVNNGTDFICPKLLTRDGHRLEQDAIIGNCNTLPPNWGSGELKIPLANIPKQM